MIEATSKDPRFAVHVAACLTAVAELLPTRVIEEHDLSKGVKRRAPKDILREPLTNAEHAFTTSLRLPRNVWNATDVAKIVQELCSGKLPLVWNGQPSQKHEPQAPSLWLQPSSDGLSMLVRCTENTHRIMVPQVIGLFVWCASLAAFERVIARAYDLTPEQVQCLVTGNQRAAWLVALIVSRIAEYNYRVWWFEHEQIVPRMCDRLHDPDFRGVSSYGMTLPDPFCDLALYCPTGRHAGERIDLIHALEIGPPPVYIALLTSLGKHLTPEVLAPIYELPNDSSPTSLP